jgi:hypothetical protein
MEGLQINFDKASIAALRKEYTALIAELESKKINIGFNTSNNAIVELKQQLNNLVEQASKIDIGSNIKTDDAIQKITQVQSKINDLKESANSID